METNVTVRFGSRGAALRSAENESVNSRRAWSSVAPRDGRLPVAASPLQRLLYTRMMTSEFVYQMALERARRYELAAA